MLELFGISFFFFSFLVCLKLQMSLSVIVMIALLQRKLIQR